MYIAVGDGRYVPYIPGIPLLCFVLMYHRRDRVGEPEVIQRFGSLYIMFKLHVWYRAALAMRTDTCWRAVGRGGRLEYRRVHSRAIDMDVGDGRYQADLLPIGSPQSSRD